MKTFCVRSGQIEVGVVEHEGHEFSAFGATVSGKQVTGYTKLVGNRIGLTTWCGQTLIASRSVIVERYWSGSMALMFRLTRNRFIVGYALGENGMLFRGELLTNVDEEEARRMSQMISECFSELDSEDEENFDSDD